MKKVKRETSRGQSHQRSKPEKQEKKKKDNLTVKVWQTITFEKARKRKREIRREKKLIDKDAD